MAGITSKAVSSPYLQREELAVASDDLVAFIIVPDKIYDEDLHSRTTKMQPNGRGCYDEDSHASMLVFTASALQTKRARLVATYVMFAWRLSLLVSSDHYIVNVGTLTGGYSSRHTVLVC